MVFGLRVDGEDASTQGGGEEIGVRPEMRCEEHAVRAAAAPYQDAKGFEAGLLERRRAVVAVQRLVSPKEGIHSGHRVQRAGP